LCNIREFKYFFFSLSLASPFLLNGAKPLAVTGLFCSPDKVAIKSNGTVIHLHRRHSRLSGDIKGLCLTNPLSFGCESRHETRFQRHEHFVHLSRLIEDANRWALPARRRTAVLSCVSSGNENGFIHEFRINCLSDRYECQLSLIIALR
jgi:hypothetical protein